jgi:tellurite resistance protein TerC
MRRAAVARFQRPHPAQVQLDMPFKKIVVAVVGGTVLVFGLALLVLPGPAILVIPVGLAILATEFVWARRWLRRARGMVNKRKARRTTRALRVTLWRKWQRLRAWLLRRDVNQPNASSTPASANPLTAPAESPHSPAPAPSEAAAAPKPITPVPCESSRRT